MKLKTHNDILNLFFNEPIILQITEQLFSSFWSIVAISWFSQAQRGVSQLYVSTLTVLEQSPVVKLLYVFYGRDTESSLFASGWWRN